MKNTNGQTEVNSYSVPEEAAKVFHNGILNHRLTKPHLLPGLEKYSGSVTFEGSSLPVFPVNWRFAESVASLKALEASYINAILDKVHGIDVQDVVINT
jgi:hypothetical protein